MFSARAVTSRLSVLNNSHALYHTSPIGKMWGQNAFSQMKSNSSTSGLSRQRNNTSPLFVPVKIVSVADRTEYVFSSDDIVVEKSVPSTPKHLSTPVQRNPFYVTTPIFYVNGEPHIGHLFTMLLADVLCRWKRINGLDAYLMCGTDEHGAKVQEASVKAGFESPLPYCDTISTKFTDAWKQFGIDYDTFIRTTSPEHKETVQWMWQKLVENGHIYVGAHEGWYCRSDETFVPEVQLVRGEDGVFKTSLGQSVEWISEDNYKFRLSAFTQPLIAWLKANPAAVTPTVRYNQVMAMLEQGLEDISVSRLSSKLQWGIDVPNDDAHKVYVWLDALNIYLSGAKQAADNAQVNGVLDELMGRSEMTSENKNINPDNGSVMDNDTADFFAETQPYWPASVQMIGKDILKFHCIYWPAFLMGCNLPLPKRVVAHGHWTVEGQKMSKSLGNVLAPADLASKYGVDSIRYSLLRIGNIKHDVNFNDSDVVNIVNNELNDVIGNLSMRSTSIALLPSQTYPDPLFKYRSEQVKKGGNFDASHQWYDAARVAKDSTFSAEDLALQAQINSLYSTVDTELAEMKVERAFEAVVEVARAANVYFTVNEPWKLTNKNGTQTPKQKVRLETVLYHCIETARVASMCLAAIVPDSAGKILSQLSVPPSQANPSVFAKFGWIPTAPNSPAAVKEVPFRKLEHAGSSATIPKVSAKAAKNPKGNKQAKNPKKKDDSNPAETKA